MVKTRRSINNANFSNSNGISFIENDWHLLYLLHQLSIIQKRWPIGFNVPNRYLKTKKKNGHDKKIFYGLGKVQYLKNLPIALGCFQVC